MPSLGIAILAGLALMALLVLVQIYLSWRPSLVWGLFLPAVFFLLLVSFALAPASLTNGFVFSETGSNMFLALAEVGLLTTALVMAFTRIGKEKLLQRKEWERRQRIEAKQLRLAAEAACLDGKMSISRSAELAERQRMEQARREAVAASERELRDIEHKRLIAKSPTQKSRSRKRDLPPTTIETAAAPDDSGHIHRIYPPEDGKPSVAGGRQVAQAFEEFGGSLLRAGRIAGPAIAKVFRRLAAGVVQAVWTIRDATVPVTAATKRRVKARLTEWRNKRNAPTGVINAPEALDYSEDETATDDTKPNE